MLYDLTDWIGERIELLFFRLGLVVKEITTTNVMDWSAAAWLLIACMLSILLLGVVIRR
ncbi:hypothetical protein [Nitratireductor basaltis]|uniref:Uncharacterized protein n=1 Tax=Nitratireductor basaltis TaxID=472175 RepID=A0A084UC20_9HYPH|nr:hypothetical protein [Nitratireductor basaltis]KFB10506.1 hypothetical protein EL18_01543 [Nitratireductor basaltis]